MGANYERMGFSKLCRTDMKKAGIEPAFFILFLLSIEL